MPVHLLDFKDLSLMSKIAQYCIWHQALVHVHNVKQISLTYEFDVKKNQMIWPNVQQGFMSATIFTFITHNQNYHHVCGVFGGLLAVITVQITIL